MANDSNTDHETLQEKYRQERLAWRKNYPDREYAEPRAREEGEHEKL